MAGGRRAALALARRGRVASVDLVEVAHRGLLIESLPTWAKTSSVSRRAAAAAVVQSHIVERIVDAVFPPDPYALPFVHSKHADSETHGHGMRFVALSNEDHIARVWDERTGQPLTVPLEHPAAISSVAFSPDDTRVVTISDCQARVWTISAALGALDAWRALARGSQADTPAKIGTLAPR